MKLYQNLIAGFVGFSLIFGANSVLFWQNSRQIEIRADKIVEDTGKEIDIAINIARSVNVIQEYTERITRLNLSVEKNRENILRYQERIEREIERINEYVEAGINETIEEIQSTYSAEKNQLETIVKAEENEAKDLEDLSELRNRLSELKQEIQFFLQLAQDNEIARANELYMEEIRQEKQIVKTLLYEYQSRSLQEIKASQSRTKESQLKYITLNNYLLILSFIVLCLFFGYMYRSLYWPIARVQDVAKENKLNLDLNPKKIRDSEFTLLAANFARILNNTNKKEKIIDSIAESLTIVDVNKTIQKVNKATLKMLGYSSEEELIGRKINVILGEEGIKNLERLTQTDYGTRGDREITYLNKKSEKIPVAFSSNIMRNHDGNLEGVVCLARDISEQYKSQQDMRKSIERSQLAFSAASSGMWDWDVKNDRVYYSPEWKSMLGYGDKEIEDTLDGWLKTIHPEEEAFAIEARINSFLKSRDSHFEATYQIRHKSGVYLWMLCRACALRDNKGKVKRLVGSQTDITKLKLAEAKLLKQALYDELTGLPNRTALIKQLEQLFDSKLKLARQKSNYNFAVMILQINRFERIDVSLGHKIGDLLLREIITRIQANLANELNITRLGENKFGVALRNVVDAKEVKAIASQIQTELAKPFTLEQRQIYINSNIGIAMSSSDYDQAEYMLRDAEKALDRAIKSEIRCAYEVFESSGSIKVLANLDLENDLYRAINNSEFKVFYQPIVQLSNNKIIGLETFICWQHPQKGLIYPEQFMAIATETGSIVPISWSIISQVCEQIRRWERQYSNNCSIFACIEISESLLYERNLVNRISDILKEAGLESHNLKLKISHTAIKNNLDRGIKFTLEKLQSLGIKIVLDNSDRAYLSLNDFDSLPIDSLKIDSKIVDPLVTSLEKFDVIKAIVNLCSGLGINVIATGVETNKESNKLLQLGCKYGQGPLFSNLLTREVAEALIANQCSDSNCRLS